MARYTEEEYFALEGTSEASYVKYLEHRMSNSPIKLLIEELWDAVRNIVDMKTHQQMVYQDGYGGEPLTPNEKRALNRAVRVMQAMQYIDAEWTPHMQEMMEDFDVNQQS